MKKALSVVLILLLGFMGGFCCDEYRHNRGAEIVDNKGFDLRLPGEVEKRIVTKDEIEVKLSEIGQLATYSEEYTVSKSVEQSRYFLEDIPILGTKNRIFIQCTGIVKVGYNIDDIQPTVDNESQRIYISLPELRVLDNYVIWDSIENTEKNSFLNPIEFSQYQVIIDEIEEEGLKQLKNEGIYSTAAENAKRVIQNFLASFDDFEIIFI